MKDTSVAKNFQNKRDFQKDFHNPQNVEIKNILTEIGQLTKLKDLDIKSFSDEKGYADILAIKLREMKTAQLRKFFGEIKTIERKLVGGENWKNVETEFYQLKLRLVHAAGRKDSSGRKLIPEEFYNVMKTILNKVNVGSDDEKKENFKMLVRFLEAIVAYHKFHGGK